MITGGVVYYSYNFLKNKEIHAHMKSSNSKKMNFEPFIIRMILLTIIIISAVLVGIGLYLPSTLFFTIATFFLAGGFILSYVAIIKMSSYDGLSRVYNSDAIVMAAVKLMILNRLPKYNCGFMNICNLKYLNTVAGSAGGDNGIAAYAKAIKKELSFGEHIGRMGGDNFVVFIKKENTEKFLEFIDSIPVTIAANGTYRTFNLKARIGMYEIKEHDNIGDIFTGSNTALAYLKESHSGYVCWYEKSMSEKAAHAQEVNSAFAEALLTGEFVPFYQPRVDGATNTLCGAEALCRWVKNGEIIAPGAFVPALEKSGQITELDFFIFEEVCKNMQRWQAEGRRLVPISSNFSKHHLMDESFAERILEIFNRYNVDKSLIELELTESDQMDDFKKLLDFLDKMNEAGITVAIDDFGVGYSSLELLKNRNFKIAKIDKSFIDNIETNGGDNINYRLLKNIAETCQSMDKHIVCEGVETAGQKDLLLKLGCTEIQGYLYDRPMSLNDFEKRMNEYTY